jgi:type I restriction enzyme, R subunit
MAYTDINTEDRLVQESFATHLRDVLGWESVYAFNDETFGPGSLLGRASPQDAVLTRDLRAAVVKLNPDLPPETADKVVETLTRQDFTRNLVQINQEYHGHLRDGVPVHYRDAHGQERDGRARVIDFQTPANNRFLAVRELKLSGLRAPYYNRRADLVCFVNGLPLVFIELKAVYLDIRNGFEQNLTDYLEEHTIPHAFHHNAFLVVSNGDAAKYGSITSGWEHFAEWKRLEETDKGSLDALILLNGMLAHERLLDILENFILFDASKPGATRKVVARNHQVLGVNRAVESVVRQEELKKQYPAGKRFTYRTIPAKPERLAAELEISPKTGVAMDVDSPPELPLVERAHPDLGRLGVFWHTQGSGKSYSMAFFTEKVRRKVSAKFTFLLMTDRTDLDTQIHGTFLGCGVAGPEAPRAGSGEALRVLLAENHRFIFSLIHKFNQNVDPKEPYSRRDDIIVISDEAHRTQAGKLARHMRLALPNAAFIGFTGTPLLKNDSLTKRIFCDYVTRYDFKRSEEDGATVKLVYEGRGEKLGIARLDLNDRIAGAIEKAELDPDQTAKVEKLLGQDYEVITADDRLEKIARDFVEHAAQRWESGKSMLVCIDKITCGRMWKLITPLWQAKAGLLRGEAQNEPEPEKRARLVAQAAWMDETRIAIIVSEAQNEIAEFKKWGVDFVPHRTLIKQGFVVGHDTLDVEKAFKSPAHPFRVAIVCAMWLTGFDVECLSTLYIDKPMKAHTLMQAIARANRVYPGKSFGLIVDYNGMLKSLRAALAQYALGDGEEGETVVAPIEDRVQALAEALDTAEAFLLDAGFAVAQFNGAKGFDRIRVIKQAVEKVIQAKDSGRYRFEILARETFIRFKALVTEPSAHTFAWRHDNLEAIYKKLQERRDTADVTSVLKELHKIVNEAIRAHPESSASSGEARQFDLSQIDLEKLRDEFVRKVKNKATAIKDIRDVVEAKLAAMLANNPGRMDFYRKYSEIIADYNREKDRVTIEDTFARLMDLMKSMDEEQKRAVAEGLAEPELAIFDKLKRDDLSKKDRERVKQASKHLLAEVQRIIGTLDRWTEKEQTRAKVESAILDQVHTLLPTPPFSEGEKQDLAGKVFTHIWQQSVNGNFKAA